MHAKKGHSPPTSFGSNITTDMPLPSSDRSGASLADPPPITAMSYTFFAVVHDQVPISNRVQTRALHECTPVGEAMFLFIGLFSCREG
jgi:hypothetical protein